MTTKKVLLFSIIGFLITAIVFGSVFYFAVYRKPTAAAKEIKTYNYVIGELYANVKESRKILKVNIVLELTDEKFMETLDSKKSMATNSILELLRSKDESQLSGEKGQQTLRNEIAKMINSTLSTDKISNVYFVEYIVQ
ncbi:MAG: flagellar basal body-associated FliL family protein [Bacillota bacterium]